MDQGSPSQVLNPKPNFQRFLLKAPSTSGFSKLDILEKLALIWNFALEIRTMPGNPVLLYPPRIFAEAREQKSRGQSLQTALEILKERPSIYRQCHKGPAKGLVSDPFNQTSMSTSPIFRYFPGEQVDIEGKNGETFTKS